MPAYRIPSRIPAKILFMAVRDSVDQEARKVAGSLSPKLPWELANPKWAASLNPVLANPLIGGQILDGIVLVSGDNTINHGLNAKLQGYIIVLNNSAVTFYDKQSTNQRPELTLILNSSGAATISLWVF
jgi:hypothetical protein